LTRSLQGPSGIFRHPFIVESLKLPKEQQDQIRAIGIEDANVIKQVGDVPEAEQSAKIAEFNQSTQEKLDKVLTDDQKTKLKELAPEPAARPN